MPRIANAGKILRQRFWRSAETHAAGFGGSDAFGLTLSDVGAFVFSDEAEHLQDDICEKGADEVFAAAGVEEWHIKDDDVYAALFGEVAPLVEDLGVIATEPVNTFDDEHVIPTQPP